MSTIDLKDRKILYQLDLNCRQSNTQIGKKVGLKKDLVAYRIKKMEEGGIIQNYWTAINTYKLGYHVFRIYINYVDVNSELKNEIISYFIKQKNLWALLSAKGPVDLDAVLWVNDIYEFNKFWNKTLEKYGNYFGKHTVSILTSVLALKKSYLLPEKLRDNDCLLYETSCAGQPVQIDKLDWGLLNILALNARISLIDLAEQLCCSSQTISYRIKQLQNKEVIQAFRVGIDPTKLNMQIYAIEIYIKDYSKRKNILEYIKTIPNVFDIMFMNVGWSDLSFEMVIQNVEILMEVMEKINHAFPDAIRRQDFWITKQVHKNRWLPELL